jgi:hypothetical protein
VKSVKKLCSKFSFKVFVNALAAKQVGHAVVIGTRAKKLQVQKTLNTVLKSTNRKEVAKKKQTTTAQHLNPENTTTLHPYFMVV